MPAVCVCMRVFIFPKSLVWFKGSKYTPIASRHTLKSGVVSSVSRAWFGLNVSVPCHCQQNVLDAFFTDSVWPIWCPCWFWFLHDHENFKHWRYMYIHKIDSPLHNFDSCADRLSYSRLFIYLTYNLLP